MARRDPYRLLWVIVFVVAGFVALGGVSWLIGKREAVVWREDLGAARAEAAKSGKRVFVDFTAEWCGPCQEMRRTTWSDRHVADALAADYVAVKVDVDRQADVARQYRVEMIPTLVVLDAQGHVAKVSSGAMGSDEFLKWLKG